MFAIIAVHVELQAQARPSVPKTMIVVTQNMQTNYDCDPAHLNLLLMGFGPALSRLTCVTLIAAIRSNNSWTSQTCVSTATARVCAVSRRRFTAKLRYPADPSECKPWSKRFLILQITTSGSLLMAARQAETSWMDLKYMLCLQISSRREASCKGRRILVNLVCEPYEFCLIRKGSYS